MLRFGVDLVTVHAQDWGGTHFHGGGRSRLCFKSLLFAVQMRQSPVREHLRLSRNCRYNRGGSLYSARNGCFVFFSPET